MSNIKFMCVADAIKGTQGKFDAILEKSIAVAVSRMSAGELREAFFPSNDFGSVSSGLSKRKAA